MTMATYIFSVTETVHHQYSIEAETQEEAEAIYYSYNQDQLKEFDLDGSDDWDKPYEIEKQG